jgi:hypothetical protein
MAAAIVWSLVAGAFTAWIYAGFPLGRGRKVADVTEARPDAGEDRSHSKSLVLSG